MTSEFASQYPSAADWIPSGNSQAAWLKRLTDWSETFVADYYKLRGWYVLRVSDIGPRAAMAEGFYEKVILPDLQLLDVAGHQYSRFVEVKTKPTGAYKYQKTGRWFTGTDLYKVHAYRKIAHTGIPVYLFFLHLKERKSDAEYKPYLLGANLMDLPDPDVFDDPNRSQNQLAVWDVSDGLGPFEHLGYLDVPEDIRIAAEAINRRIYPWDQPPRLRQPSNVQGELEF